MTMKIACVAAAMTLATAALAQDAKPAPKPAPAPAADAKPAKTLTIGDTAPAIDISNWIKGEKVASFDKGKVYVVEFWATWCGPCKVSMPHLSEAQAQYKDYGATFIGISDEPLEVVTKWLDSTDAKSGKKWSDLIAYTLTTDPDKSVKTDYFAAAGQRGIPSAFIVGKDQKIEWIGNPHPQSTDGFDKALEAVVKDNWDRAKFKTEWEQKASSEKAAAENQSALATAMKNKDWKKVIEIADSQLKTDPKDVNAAMLKWHTMVAEAGDSAKGYEFLKNFLTNQHWDDAKVLNMFSWTILDDKAIKDKDMNYATGLAMRANKLTSESDPEILDTYARCWYERGNLVEAVKWQTTAAQLAPAGDLADQINATLKKYQDELAKKGG